MDMDNAYDLIGLVDEMDPYRRNKEIADLHPQAALWAEILHDVPMQFAWDYVLGQGRAGTVVRAPSEISAAWKAEASERLAQAEYQLEPPAEIADDPHQWQAWLVRARRAVSEGASVGDAKRRADQAVGVSRALETEETQIVDAEESKRRLRSLAQKWTLNRLSGGE